MSAEATREVLSLLVEELQSVAELYRRRSVYKKYSRGMKSAFRNRALGLEKAVKLTQSILPEDSSL